jgi:hypothetical protein
MVKRQQPPMSAEHKAALAAGRAEGRAVRRYLEALEEHKPRRGRKRTSESLQKRLAAIEEKLGSADALQRLQLVQERRDLQAELDRTSRASDLTNLEADFVKVAKGYSDRKGISYSAWREVGVPSDVLGRAGITRGG